LLPRLSSTILAGTFLLLLAGCGGLFHSNARPAQVYFLRAGPAPGGVAPVAASLRFMRPSAAPGLETAQIVLVESDRRMSYFVASLWPAPISNVVDLLAVEKLRGSGVWQSVADSTSAFPSDYVLQVMVRRFEADYTGGGTAPEVYVVLDCILGRREGREVIASFLAQGSAVAAANKLGAVVAAFETAANAALDSLSVQTAEAVRTSMARKSSEQ
jgi:cholesterol transport system auxiliary component